MSLATKLLFDSRDGGSMEIVDLSVALGEPGAAMVKGHEPPTFEPINTHEEHYLSNARASFSLHTGTHVDAPYHFCSDGITIDELPLEKVVGPALVADLRGVAGRRTALSPEHIEANIPGRDTLKGVIIILYTGWLDKAYHTERYYLDNPYLSIDAARWLVESGIEALALDSSVDTTLGGAKPSPESHPVHRILLGNGIPLIENVTNLDKLLGRKVQLFALPVKIYREGGAPARVIAVIE